MKICLKKKIVYIHFIVGIYQHRVSDVFFSNVSNLPNLCPSTSGVWTTSPCVNWNGLCLFITNARRVVSLNTGISYI